MINIAQAGVITDAPNLTEVLMRVLDFLLTVAGMLALIGLIISGITYLVSSGDEKLIAIAKKSFNYSIIGMAVVLGALVIIETVTHLIS